MTWVRRVSAGAAVLLAAAGQRGGRARLHWLRSPVHGIRPHLGDSGSQWHGGTVTLTSGCVYTLTAVNNTTDGAASACR